MKCVLLTVLLTTLFINPSWTVCDSSCVCQLKNTKQIATCTNANFETLPKTLDPNSQVLDLSDNHIVKLVNEAFKKANLMNLQRIYMRKNGIKEIDEDAFRYLYNLLDLDLSDNEISHIEADTFPRWLKRLCLSGNPIKRLDQFDFLNPPHLETLELDRCQIEDIHPKAFLQLIGLKFLKLNSNKLQTLPATVFKDNKNLIMVSLEGNPWMCDCKLREFYGWLIEQNMVSDNVKCENPLNFKNQTWKNVPFNQFTCSPK